MWMIPESQIEEEFAKFDADKSGFIDCTELTNVLKSIFDKYNLEADPKRKATIILGNADKNADDKISLEEFKKAFTSDFR